MCESPDRQSWKTSLFRAPVYVLLHIGSAALQHARKLHVHTAATYTVLLADTRAHLHTHSSSYCSPREWPYPLTALQWEKCWELEGIWRGGEGLRGGGGRRAARQTDRQTGEAKRQKKAEEGEVWKRLPRVNICQSWFDFVCLGVCALARKTVSCEVCLWVFFFQFFCCSFSEIYTVGLNPALHQRSGSAYSNTRADQHTHTRQK